VGLVIPNESGATEIPTRKPEKRLVALHSPPPPLSLSTAAAPNAATAAALPGRVAAHTRAMIVVAEERHVAASR
jgi:hypothetical protein